MRHIFHVVQGDTSVSSCLRSPSKCLPQLREEEEEEEKDEEEEDMSLTALAP